MIHGVRKVVLPVEDQQSALEFWVEKAGFKVTIDLPYGDSGRWLEISPPDGLLSLVLSLRRPDSPKPRVPDELPHSDVFFNCRDIQTTFRELKSRGVRFPSPPAKLPFGWWSMFEDHEGTRFALGQWE